MTSTRKCNYVIKLNTISKIFFLNFSTFQFGRFLKKIAELTSVRSFIWWCRWMLEAISGTAMSPTGGRPPPAASHAAHTHWRTQWPTNWENIPQLAQTIHSPYHRLLFQDFFFNFNISHFLKMNSSYSENLHIFA